MRIVKPEQVKKLTEIYEESLLDCVGALDDVLSPYVKENFPDEIDGYYDFDDVESCEEFLCKKYGDFYASSNSINWNGYANIFNFNETANDGFWSHWDDLVENGSIDESDW